MSSLHLAGIAMHHRLCEASIPDGIPSFGATVDGSPIVQSINIIKSIRKQKKMARGGHQSVKMATDVWPQQVGDL